MKKSKFHYQEHRNSYTALNEVYFWTITINKWQHLLRDDQNKMLIIESLRWLQMNHLIRLYGYVIMPNHLHLIWNQLKMNGREFPKNSFEKYTAKQLMKNLQQDKNALACYAVNASDRNYNIWQRDPLAVRVFSREMLIQKLNYIHRNPLQAHWALCSFPEEYRFSSAGFYANGADEFELITHYMELF